MAQTDVDRIDPLEEHTTFTAATLDGVLEEIDSRTTGANCYPVVARSAGLITQISYYSDLAHTLLKLQRTFSRTAGTDGVLYITGIISIFYNSNGTEDSRVTTTIARDPTDNWITACSNVFSTGESIC